MSLRITPLAVMSGFIWACGGPATNSTERDPHGTGGVLSGDGDTGDGDGDGDDGPAQSGGTGGAGDGDDTGGGTGGGTGGTDDSASGGEGGTGGTSGPLPDAAPTPGCALGELPAPSLTTGAVFVPSHYDGSTPLPLVIAFHGQGHQLTGLTQANPADPSTSPSLLAEDFVIALPSATQTWETKGIDDYDAAYSELAEKICFDASRVFGIGNAGGGRFLDKVLEAPPAAGVVRPGQFRALGISGAMFGSSQSNWSLPMIFTHSQNDQMAVFLANDADGQKALTGFINTKDCAESSTPSGSSTCHQGGTQCSDFQACDTPLRFCAYDLSTNYDAWQCAYGIEMHRFFSDYL